MIKTVYLVRHAEKEYDGGFDPGLTTKGIKRSLNLAEFFEYISIDAIYSSGAKRVDQTLWPLANSKELNIEYYSNDEHDKFLSYLIFKEAYNCIVIGGHQNTIPELVNQIIGKFEFSRFEDHEYDNIIQIILQNNQCIGFARLKVCI